MELEETRGKLYPNVGIGIFQTFICYVNDYCLTGYWFDILLHCSLQEKVFKIRANAIISSTRTVIELKKIKISIFFHFPLLSPNNILYLNLTKFSHSLQKRYVRPKSYERCHCYLDTSLLSAKRTTKKTSVPLVSGATLLTDFL